MSINPATLQIAVSSVVSAALTDITVRRATEVFTIEETPGINIMFPAQELTEGFAVGESTFSFLSQWTIPIECYAWGEDSEDSFVNNAALVRSLTNVLRQTGNRQINGAAVMSRVLEGSPIDPDKGAIGFMSGYLVTLEADVFEGQT